MQGVSLITDPQGQPKILTIDVQLHDRQLDPLVRSLLTLLQQQEEATERAEWLAFSSAQLERAYGEDEPDYDETDLIERNPNYRPQ